MGEKGNLKSISRFMLTIKVYLLFFKIGTTFIGRYYRAILLQLLNLPHLDTILVQILHNERQGKSLLSKCLR